jgi:hypothetical protein
VRERARRRSLERSEPADERAAQRQVCPLNHDVRAAHAQQLAREQSHHDRLLRRARIDQTREGRDGAHAAGAAARQAGARCG